MTYICQNCISDEYLKVIVADEGEVQQCDHCEEDQAPAISVERLAQLVDEVFRKIYGPGETVPRVGDGDDDRVYWIQDGDDLDTVIQIILGDLLSCHEELIDELIALDDYWPPDGEEAFYDVNSNYERIRYRGFEGSGLWTQTLQELKHSRRFFSPSAKALFSSLFDGVDSLQTRIKRRNYPVVRILRTNTKLYRARICRSMSDFETFANDPFRHVGPAPSAAARNGRMNAEGVSVLYTALDERTCLAEIRPAISTQLALIKLETTAPLRILDFTRLEQAVRPHALSYFHPTYFEERNRMELLKDLHRLISQPIRPERESDYLITQTMAEYLAHVHEKPFDGIIFSSAQRNGGKNVVIFPNRIAESEDLSSVFRVQYVPGSLASFRTEAISYKHERDNFFYFTDDDGKISGPYFDDENDDF